MVLNLLIRLAIRNKIVMLAHHLVILFIAVNLLRMVLIPILSNELAALNLLLDALEVLVYARLLVVEVLVVVLEKLQYFVLFL